MYVLGNVLSHCEKCMIKPSKKKFYIGSRVWNIIRSIFSTYGPMSPIQIFHFFRKQMGNLRNSRFLALL